MKCLRQKTLNSEAVLSRRIERTDPFHLVSERSQIILSVIVLMKCFAYTRGQDKPSIRAE